MFFCSWVRMKACRSGQTLLTTPPQPCTFTASCNLRVLIYSIECYKALGNKSNNLLRELKPAAVFLKAGAVSICSSDTGATELHVIFIPAASLHYLLLVPRHDSLNIEHIGSKQEWWKLK